MCVRVCVCVWYLELRILCLDIVEKSVRALYHDTGNLLPTVHNVWEALKPRYLFEFSL
jgi:hypothetical protein